MAGAGLAFLWFNAHPAQIFMGDVGALALGGALAQRFGVQAVEVDRLQEERREAAGLH